MIPHRIKLAGFLSYKDEQEIRFGGAPVWMLSGTNGSGKSSIFDAVTYALFGHHRGGSQNAAELINKDSSALSVTFDFQLDGQLYRIKRTLRRSNKGAIAGTQQVFRNLGADADDWEAVPDTNKKVDFDRWIHEKIGLDYDTFTSSVLLLQGKAEKLLDSKPSGRAEVLAGIVDLERYQRLHESANARKLKLKSQLEANAHQVEGVPEVSDEEFAQSVVRIQIAEDRRQQTMDLLDVLATRELQSQRWSDTQVRHLAAIEKLRRAELLLGEAVQIEAAYTRLQELRDVLPAVNTVVTVRSQMAESVRKVERHELDRREAEERKRKAEVAEDSQRRQRTILQKHLTQDEEQLRKSTTRLRELSGQLKTLEWIEQQESALVRYRGELDQLPADAEGKLKQAQAERERLETLQRVLPTLQRFQKERHDLSQARAIQASASTRTRETKTLGEQVKAEHKQAGEELAAARQVRTVAEQHLAVSSAQLDQARMALAELDKHGQSALCHACGQPLTAEHLAEERQKRSQQLRQAEKRSAEALQAQSAAIVKEQQATEREKKLQGQLEQLRDQFKEASSEAKQATTDEQRLTASLELLYAEMPEPYRMQIAERRPQDWVKTDFPHREDLTHLQRDAAGLDAAKRLVRELEQTLAKLGDLRTRMEQTSGTLANLRATLPNVDVAALRRENATLQAQEATLQNSIKAGKMGIETADREIDKASREAHQASQHITEIRGKLAAETVNQNHCKQAVDREMQQLPDRWQPLVQPAGLRDYNDWKAEHDELVDRGTEARYKQLEVARAGLTAIREQIAALAREAEEFPPEVRRDPSEVKAEIQSARVQLELQETELRQAQRARDELERFREQRSKLTKQYKSLDALHNRYKILSELLGRDRLQRHLVRQAERQIVDYANAVLDRLSGGQLFLKLVTADDGTDRALELECANRISGGAPINVTFLSGSQRFRVAVSLALAIGQYASKQHRPIESVIIDEGFGCLDRQGRQVMIQELQNLRGHLNCILLVSHQEEFADAFNDGYRFELRDGATHVSRIQK
jgi:exonuclease SbcC